MKRIFFAFALTAALLLSSCSDNGGGEMDEVNIPNYTENSQDMFSEDDLSHEYDEGSCTITLSGTSASSDSAAVKISGTLITVTRGGTYIVSGALEGGSITVDAPEGEDVRIVLAGAEITADGTAAIYASEANKLIITLADGTENSITVSGELGGTEDGIDGALFSRTDLTLNGKGSLTVESPSGHGIVAKDDLVISGGHITVSCASHAIDANDSVRLTAAALTLGAGKDGIHAENTEDASLGYVYILDGTLEISAEGDGISASSSVQINGGDFNIITGGGYVNAQKQTSDNWGDHMGGFGHGDPGGRPGGPGQKPDMGSGSSTDTSTEDSTSIKGIKAGAGIVISGGAFKIDSADDSIHSNDSIVIKGGVFEISSGDDGIHADKSLALSGGTVNVLTSYEGLEALEVSVTGGSITLVASDDGINAAGGADGSGMGGMRPGGDFGGMSSSSKGSIVISGGALSITAYGDGLDANGTLEISGGHTTVAGPTSGDTATLDYDVSGIISGGTFIGTGASGMAQSFSDSEQGVIAVSVGGSMPAGDEIVITATDGREIIRYSPPLSFAVVIISTPDMVKGESYTITIGDVSGTFSAS